MNKRSVSYLALTAAGAAVLVAVVVLLIKVKSPGRPPELDPAEMVRATAVAGQGPGREPPVPEPASNRPHLPRVKHLGASLRSGVVSEGGTKVPHASRNDLPAAGEDSNDSKLQSTASEATSFYDRGDYDAARNLAVEVLEQAPDPHTAERMLRIAASASCFMGEADQARAFYDRLTPKGQQDIARRCSRAGIEFH